MFILDRIRLLKHGQMASIRADRTKLGRFGPTPDLTFAHDYLLHNLLDSITILF